jgi:hypothetical protein
MPPIDGSSIGSRLGSFLSALSASPPPPRLVSPTREFLEGLVGLSSPYLALLLRAIKVRLVGGSQLGLSRRGGGAKRRYACSQREWHCLQDKSRRPETVDDQTREPQGSLGTRYCHQMF